MVMLNTTKPAAIARIETLQREIALLNIAQPHLHGIPARHNTLRLLERAQELETLLYAVDKFGPDWLEAE